MILLVFGSLAASGLGLAVTLILFLALKRELHAQLRREQERVTGLKAEIDVLRAMLSKTNPGEEASAPKESPAPAQLSGSAPWRIPSGINISKRTHAIRLLRRGEDAAHIAAALSLPRREVELLIRVHRMCLQRIAQAAG